MIDANADIHDPQFASFLLDCGLHDLYANSSLDLPPETYFRGTKKKLTSAWVQTEFTHRS